MFIKFKPKYLYDNSLLIFFKKSISLYNYVFRLFTILVTTQHLLSLKGDFASNAM